MTDRTKCDQCGKVYKYTTGLARHQAKTGHRQREAWIAPNTTSWTTWHSANLQWWPCVPRGVPERSE